MNKPRHLAIVTDGAAASADDGLLLLEKIAGLIAEARALKLSETVFLLNMAHLDLQTKIHNIDNDELQAFVRVVRRSIGRAKNEP